MSQLPINPTRSELPIYETGDKHNRIQIRMKDKTVWRKQASGDDYFDKLLARIRDMRT